MVKRLRSAFAVEPTRTPGKCTRKWNRAEPSRAETRRDETRRDEQEGGMRRPQVGTRGGVRRGGCKVHDGRRAVYMHELARVRLPSANRMIMPCIEERALRE